LFFRLASGTALNDYSVALALLTDTAIKPWL